MLVWRAVRGEGSELRARPEPRVLPPKRLRAEDSRRTKDPPNECRVWRTGISKKVLDVWPGGPWLRHTEPGLTGPAGLQRGAVVIWSDRSGEFAPSFSAVRPMFAGQKEETGKWELDWEIFSRCIHCETKCSLDERENVSALPGKFLLRALRDQMLAGQKEENESLTGRFSHTASTVRPNARWTKEKT